VNTSHLTDFPDRFSPMLVKELRQGTRARTFTIIFLGMQLLLGLLMMTAMIASESEQAGGMVSGIVFTFFILAVVVMQPLRGINALSSEMRDQTIDLMTLTRLTSWRIVLGKWVAIVSQSALLMVTIIPYLIMRYFFGGMNLVAEITALLCLFGASMALTAFAVGISACKLMLARVLLPVAVGLGIFFSLVFASFSMAMGGSGPFGMSMDDDWILQVSVYFATLLYLGHQVMSMGASLIASASENHALTRRIITLLALVAVAVPAAIYRSGNDEVIWFFFVPIVVVPAMVIALSETGQVAPRVIERFRRFGVLGMVAGAFLIPGRASGYLFTLLVVGAVAVMMVTFRVIGQSFWNDEMVRLAGIWGALLFPAVLLRFIQRDDSQRVGGYVLILIASIFCAGVMHAFAEAAGDETLLLFAWFPAVYIFGDVDAYNSASGLFLILAMLLILNGLLAVGSIRDLNEKFRRGPVVLPPTP
jgi:hypothetical protein